MNTGSIAPGRPSGDLTVRDALIFDGYGPDLNPASLCIVDGRIAEIGPRGSGWD